jgi:hypothetical protein
MKNKYQCLKIGSGSFYFFYIFELFSFVMNLLCWMWVKSNIYIDRHGIQPLSHWQRHLICLWDTWQGPLLWNLKTSILLNLAWLSVLTSLGKFPTRFVSVCVWFWFGCGVDSFLLLMMSELIICLFCFCRLAKLLQCLVKILYLMVVPFWFMVFPELSLKFLNWLHIIKNASGSSALVFFSLSV